VRSSVRNGAISHKLFGVLLLYTIFFQAVGIFPNSDTQPNFIILSCFSLIFYNKSLTFSYVNLLAFIGCYFCLVLAFLLQAEYLTLKYILTYTVSLLSFLLIFVLVKNERLNLSSEFLLTVTAIYAFVGFVQFFIPDFFSFLVTRSVDAAFSFAESGRGVRSLTGEPAHLGKVFTILNVLFLFSMWSGGTFRSRPNQLILVSILFIFVNLVISRSFYSVVVHGLIFLVFICLVNKRLFIYLSVVSFFTFGLILSLVNNVYGDIRFVRILDLLLNNPSLLLEQGAARRVFNIPLSINNLTYFDWYGAGSNPKSFIAELQTPVGPLYYPGFNRAYGGLVEFLLKFGFFSIPIFWIYFLLLFRISRIRGSIKGKNVAIGLFFAISIFILTVQDGAMAKPLPMFLLAYIYVNRSYLSRNS